MGIMSLFQFLICYIRKLIHSLVCSKMKRKKNITLLEQLPNITLLEQLQYITLLEQLQNITLLEQLQKS